MSKICPVCSVAYPDANAFCPTDGTTLRTVELDVGLIGSVIADRYLITELIGEGGMGRVYLARHVRLPQQAAIKILRAELVRDPASVSRFNREASNASQIEDLHVARVYDFGETTDGVVFLAMEYVQGTTLRRIIETEGPLAPRRAAELVRQIAAGLDAAHHLPKPLIHRDLKPDNVLVATSPNGRERVKVVDFGIAKAFGADDRSLTQTGFVVGTPEFMSPEQLLGEPLDARSDVYALGLVAYQCLTGTLPFQMTTPGRALMARLTDSPRQLLEQAPGHAWPASVQAAFDTVLARDRADRPETAGAFAERLVAAIDEAWPEPGAPIRAAVLPTPAFVPVPTASLAPRPAAPAPRRSVWPVAALVLAVAGGGVLYARGRSAAPTPTPPVDAPAVDTTVPTVPAAATGAAPRRAPSPARPAPATASTTASTTRPTLTPGVAVDSTAPTPADAAPASPLDSLVGAMDGRSVDAAEARTLAAAIRALVPTLGRDQRTRAQLALVRASILGGDLTGACEALRTATASATRAEQRAQIRRLDGQLGCE